jgi:hypothetical protein
MSGNDRAQNAAIANQIASVQAGHLAAQRALWKIAQREGGQELIDAARRGLGDDVHALAAFARSLLRGREVAG